MAAGEKAHATNRRPASPRRDRAAGSVRRATASRASAPASPAGAMRPESGRTTSAAPSKPVETISADELQGAIRENVDKGARIMTDEFPSYRGIGREFSGGHKTVNHGKGQYAKGKGYEINVNSAESYFALLKRGIHGTFHHVSKKHLSRYCDEFSFRWGQR